MWLRCRSLVLQHQDSRCCSNYDVVGRNYDVTSAHSVYYDIIVRNYDVVDRTLRYRSPHRHRVLYRSHGSATTSYTISYPIRQKYISWRYNVTFYHDISQDIVDFSRSISVFSCRWESLYITGTDCTPLQAFLHPRLREMQLHSPADAEKCRTFAAVVTSATQETSKGYLLSHSQLCVHNVNLNWGVC